MEIEETAEFRWVQQNSQSRSASRRPFRLGLQRRAVLRKAFATISLNDMMG
jgi:hypothetical protein